MSPTYFDAGGGIVGTIQDAPADVKPCRRHSWVFGRLDIDRDGYLCVRCRRPKDPIRSRRGATARSYGTRAELKIARQYGGVKTGHHGGPVDIEGKDWDSQVKTHRRLPPAEWRKAFAGMTGPRLPRLFLRFLPGPGLPPDDYIVVRGLDWLAWFGKDEG